MLPLIHSRQPVTIELSKVNQFCENIGKVQQITFEVPPTEYTLWIENAYVSIQVSKDFNKRTEKRKFSVKGGNEISYIEKGKPVKDIDNQLKRLLIKLFDKAQDVVSLSNGREVKRETVSSDFSSEESASGGKEHEYFATPDCRILLSFRKKFANIGPGEKKGYSDRLLTLKKEFPVEDASQDGCSDFFTSEVALRNIYLLSREIFGLHYDNLIFSLGQSPAWFAATAQIDQPKPERFCHVAFSGSWYDLDVKNQEDLFGRISEVEASKLYLKPLKGVGKAPNKEQTKFYRSYLSGIGCSPENLVKQKKPAIIVDYVTVAGGMKSFLEFLYEWADEDKLREGLRKKLIVHCLIDKGSTLSHAYEGNMRVYLQNNFEAYSEYPIVTMSVVDHHSRAKSELRAMLSPKSTPNIAKRRLVKHFPFSLWNEENCKTHSFGNPIDSYIEPIYFKLYEQANTA